MQLQLAFELRSPDCGAPHRELYAAALDQGRNGPTSLGFDAIGLGEHHASP